MKSIRTKLFVIFTIIVVTLNTTTGFVTRNLVSKKLVSDTHGQLIELAEQEAKYLEAIVKADLDYLSVLSNNPILTNEQSTIEQKAAFFEAEAKRSGFILFGFADTQGKAIILNNSMANNDVSDRDFFKKALSGTPASSDLMFSKLDGEPVIVFASPVYQNGEISGVLYGRKNGLMLSEIVSKLKYKETGYAYMVNNNGDTVAHKNTDLVLAQDNDIENMKTDSSLKQLGELTKSMITRTVNSGEYTYGGVDKIVGFAPVENTPWIVAFGVEKSEVLAGTNELHKTLLIMFIIMGVTSAVAVIFVSGGIGKPIKKVTSAAQEIAQGNFDVTLDVKSKDEVGKLAESFSQTLTQLSNYQDYIDEISTSLEKVGQGNLQVTLEKEYLGQFKKLKENLEGLVSHLSHTLLQIQQSAEQVDSGALQIANSAQALSQGATEQASSIQELSGSIASVTEQVQQNAESAKQARDKAENAGQELSKSNGQMQHMMDSMKDITDKASEISKIIKIIDDIAFQTNILALNAAVEAARAGAAGKGFAVVADEVRNLAAKSAEAARNTSVLIEETIDSVNNGFSIAEKTAVGLTNSAHEAMGAINLIDNIAQASLEQASAIVQVNEGVEQISAVVQTNAATAEENSAASEEMSSQAIALRDEVAKFRLKRDSQHNIYINLDDETHEYSNEKESDNFDISMF